MKNKHLFFSLLIALLAFSCSSDDDDDGNYFLDFGTLKLKSFTEDTDVYKISYTDNLPITITKPDNTDIVLDYNLEKRLIKFGDYRYDYDASGKLSSVQNQDGTCNFEYNDQGLISAQNIVTNNQVIITRTFSYNSTNNLTRIRETNNLIGPVDVLKMSFTYNDQGLPSEIRTEESRNNGATFNILGELVVSYEPVNNPLKLFSESLGFTANIVPLFNNSLKPRLVFNTKLGFENYFLLDYMTPNPIRRIKIKNNFTKEYFEYTNTDRYPTDARYIWEDDFGINDVANYNWEYTID